MIISSCNKKKKKSQKTIYNIIMPAFLRRKMAYDFNYKQNLAHVLQPDLFDTTLAAGQSSEEEEQEQEQQTAALEHPLIALPSNNSFYSSHHTGTTNNYTPSTASSTSSYSLTSGPLYHQYRTHSPHSTAAEIRKQPCPCMLAFASPNSTTSSSSSHHDCSLEEHIPQHAHLFPSIHPPHHMKTLLSQLASSISSSLAAFSLMRASSTACKFANNAYGKAEKSMEEELHRLSGIHLRLYSVVQQQADFGTKQDIISSHETSSVESMGVCNAGSAHQRQETMLKLYEGIISRFHDEIRKKDAVAEALKETLAKSMLKGEKLERRMKALEAKISPPVQPK